jgi:hypothetical protein
MEVNGDGDANDYLDDPDFMSPFIIYVIDHIQNNFERFTTQEGNVVILIRSTLNK